MPVIKEVFGLLLIFFALLIKILNKFHKTPLQMKKMCYN